MYTSRDEAEVADTRGSALATGFGTRADRYLALALKSTLGLIATRAGLLGRLSDLALLLLASHTVPDCGQRSAVLVFGVSSYSPPLKGDSSTFCQRTSTCGAFRTKSLALYERIVYTPERVYTWTIKYYSKFSYFRQAASFQRLVHPYSRLKSLKHLVNQVQ